MQVSLSMINRQNCSLITGHLLSFCRREREDAHLVSECLKELRSIVCKFCHGPDLLQQMIKLLKADSNKNPCELVRTFVKQIKREIVTGRLTGPVVAKELFLALTVLPTPASAVESDDEALSNVSSSSATRSLLPLHDSKPTVALMQATVWACGYWSWRGIVDESLCSCADLVDFLIAMLGMQQSLRGFVLNALLRMAGQAESALILKSLKETGASEEDIKMTILLLQQGIYPSNDIEEGSIVEEDINEEVEESEQVESVNERESNFGKVDVVVDQVIKNQGGVQVQFLLTSTTSLRDVSVALAVSKDYDFDYLQPASSNTLSSPDEAISLAVVLKKRATKPSLSVDLLDLLDDDNSSKKEEDFNLADCQLRMRVQYTIVSNGETETHVSPISL